MSKELNAIADELLESYKTISAAEEKAFRAAHRLLYSDEEHWHNIWETWQWTEHYTEDKAAFRKNFAKFIKDYELACEFELLKSQYEEAGLKMPIA